MILLVVLMLTGCKSTQKGEQNNASEATPAANKESAETSIPEPSTPATLEISVEEGVFWQPYQAENLPDLAPLIQPKEFELWYCELDRVRSQLRGQNAETLLPFRGKLMLFTLTNSGTMNPALAEKFPLIKSYKGQSHDGAITVRVDSNEKGIYASYQIAGEEWLLAPYLDGSDRYYAFYNKSDLANPGRSDDFENPTR